MQVGDVGTVLTVTVRENSLPVALQSASVKNFIFTRPDGTTVSKAATYVTDGSDGMLTYTVESGVLTLVGFYTLHVSLTIGAWSGISTKATFAVYA